MKSTIAVAVLGLVLVVGCGSQQKGNTVLVNRASKTAPTAAAVFINVTSDITKKPQAIDMAMKIGRFSLAEGRRVFYFFNVKGVHIPCTTLDPKVGYTGQKPIREQLEALIKDGAVVHVCPICMKSLGVDKKDILPGAEVTTRAGLFERIQSDTVVFTY